MTIYYSIFSRQCSFNTRLYFAQDLLNQTILPIDRQGPRIQRVPSFVEQAK